MRRLIKAAIFAWVAKKLYDYAQRRKARKELAERDRTGA
jgi:hypothetical protein